MNEHFISIKVDREERPDLDQIYMSAVQALTGRGGWPMSVFLTPKLEPFYGGTYWPPDARMGMPGFRDVLDAVHEAWRERRGRCRARRARADRQPVSQSRSADGRAATARRLAARDGRGDARADGRPRCTAVSAVRRSFRIRWICGCCCGRRSDSARADALEIVRVDARQDGGRRNLRPSGRRFSSLLDRRALAGAAFREDALRQRPAWRRPISKPFWPPASRTTPKSSAKRWTTCSAK